MAAPIKITHVDLGTLRLRLAARWSSSVATSRRMLALALVLDGKSRTEAAQAVGMDRQTLRNWVHRYNEEGLAGLSDRHGDFGSRRRLSPKQEAKAAAWVRAGDLAEHLSTSLEQSSEPDPKVVEQYQTFMIHAVFAKRWNGS